MGLFSRKRSKVSTSPAQTRGAAWTGRGLRMPAPPDAANGAEQAAFFVDAAKKIDGAVLDYSRDSLAWVDAMLGALEEAGSDATAETIVSAGFYVGEVLVRGHGYRWVDLDEHVASMFGFPVAVVSPTGAYSNPIGKAFKRVENGEEDSVEFLVAAELASEERRAEDRKS